MIIWQLEKRVPATGGSVRYVLLGNMGTRVLTLHALGPILYRKAPYSPNGFTSNLETGTGYRPYSRPVASLFVLIDSSQAPYNLIKYRKEARLINEKSYTLCLYIFTSGKYVEIVVPILPS